jgi:hypothetical protein
VVSGVRGDVGQDTLSYGRIYAEMVDFDALKYMLLRQEPFFNLLMYLQKQVFDSYTGFLILIAFLQMLTLSYATRDMYHRNIFLYFTCLYFSCNYILMLKEQPSPYYFS